MSGVNGDKSRFHRERKQKIARRIRNRVLLTGLGKPGKAPVAAPAAKPKVQPA
jgi:hypothetical protein